MTNNNSKQFCSLKSKSRLYTAGRALKREEGLAHQTSRMHFLHVMQKCMILIFF